MPPSNDWLSVSWRSTVHAESKRALQQSSIPPTKFADISSEKELGNVLMMACRHPRINRMLRRTLVDWGILTLNIPDKPGAEVTRCGDLGLRRSICQQTPPFESSRLGLPVGHHDDNAQLAFRCIRVREAMVHPRAPAAIESWRRAPHSDINECAFLKTLLTRGQFAAR